MLSDLYKLSCQFTSHLSLFTAIEVNGQSKGFGLGLERVQLGQSGKLSTTPSPRGVEREFMKRCRLILPIQFCLRSTWNFSPVFTPEYVPACRVSAIVCLRHLISVRRLTSSPSRFHSGEEYDILRLRMRNINPSFSWVNYTQSGYSEISVLASPVRSPGITWVRMTFCSLMASPPDDLPFVH